MSKSKEELDKFVYSFFLSNLSQNKSLKDEYIDFLCDDESPKGDIQKKSEAWMKGYFHGFEVASEIDNTNKEVKNTLSSRDDLLCYAEKLLFHNDFFKEHPYREMLRHLLPKLFTNEFWNHYENTYECIVSDSCRQCSIY